jgi:hypothetical protein
MVDIVAQQARAFGELRNQLAFQIERHELAAVLKAFRLFRIFKL